MAEHAKKVDHRRCKGQALGHLRLISYKLNNLQDMFNDNCPAIWWESALKDIEDIESRIDKFRRYLMTK